jgi:hypothetical protein
MTWCALWRDSKSILGLSSVVTSYVSVRTGAVPPISLAKFSRVLDSTKARFGILFSKSGISGSRTLGDARLEQIKLFQDRGIVIVVVDRNDLAQIASGANFTELLRKKYEEVRLDLRNVRRDAG